MHLSEKQLKRVERKKKKLAALIEITELNDKERSELHRKSKSGLIWNHTESGEEVSKLLINNSGPMNSEEDYVAASLDDQSKSSNEGTSSYHKKKKKRKNEHREEVEIGDKPILKTESSSDVQNIKVKKRKSTSELEIQKDHLKLPKLQKDYYLKTSIHSRFDDSLSYADELASFKKDREKSRIKKEKKEKREGSQADEKMKDFPESHSDSQENPTMDESNDCDELKKLMKARKKQLKVIPNVRLKGVGKEADLGSLEHRVPVLPCDVQSFLLLSQLGHDVPKFPRWVELKRFNRLSKTVVLVVEGLSAYDFYAAESSCPTLCEMGVKAEMVSPYCYNCGIVEELCAVPLTRQQKKDLERRYGKEICPEALLTDKVIKVLRSAFSISSVPKTKADAVEQKISVPSTDKFPRTELLLSAWQLIEEGYPLPFGSTELGNRYPDYVMTKEQYSEVTPSSPMWALDCEMCLTRAGNELTRVSVVNEKHETVYESLCMPPNPIKNYLTEFSGITPEMMKGVTTRLEDIQKDLRELFPSDVILVGQSLNGDLHALKMMHPYVIDTSVIFNLTGIRRHKSKLSKLTEEFLNELIQQRGAEGHDSVEDSLAALKLVQHKLTKSIEYGDAVLAGLKNDSKSSSDNFNTSSDYPEHSAGDFDDLKVEVGPTMATSIFKHFTMKKKSVCVIAPEETLAEYSTFVAAAHRENKQLVRTLTTENSSETVHRACHECKTANFTLAHTVLSEEEDITLVDSWVKQLQDSPPFNSLIVVVLVGSHKNFANGAVMIKVKKPNLRLKPIKKDKD